MKTLLVYYSLSGNTEYIAEKIEEKIGGTLLKLVPQKAYANKGFAKFFWGGKSAVMAEKPKLENNNIKIEEYDRVIIGFPVWAGTFAPPLRTFVIDNKTALKGKKISAFACQGGAGAEKAFKKLLECLKIESFDHTAVFIDPKEKPSEENKLRLDMFYNKLNSDI